MAREYFLDFAPDSVDFVRLIGFLDGELDVLDRRPLEESRNNSGLSNV